MLLEVQVTSSLVSLVISATAFWVSSLGTGFFLLDIELEIELEGPLLNSIDFLYTSQYLLAECCESVEGTIPLPLQRPWSPGIPLFVGPSALARPL